MTSRAILADIAAKLEQATDQLLAAESNEHRRDFYSTLRRVAKKARADVVNWSDIRTTYKRRTGRTLGIDELNAICGTTNIAKRDLLETHLAHFVKPVDPHGYQVRVLPFHVSPSASTTSSRSSTPAHVSGEELKSTADDRNENASPPALPAEEGVVVTKEDISPDSEEISAEVGAGDSTMVMAKPALDVDVSDFSQTEQSDYITVATRMEFGFYDAKAIQEALEETFMAGEDRFETDIFTMELEETQTPSVETATAIAEKEEALNVQEEKPEADPGINKEVEATETAVATSKHVSFESATKEIEDDSQTCSLIESDESLTDSYEPQTLTHEIEKAGGTAEKEPKEVEIVAETVIKERPVVEEKPTAAPVVSATPVTVPAKKKRSFIRRVLNRCHIL